MPKKRAKSSEEWFRGRIRELEKENRALKKLLKHIEKKEHIFDESTNIQDEEVSGDSEDTFPILKYKIPCEECGKGFFAEYEIMGKVIGTCNICGERRRLK